MKLIIIIMKKKKAYHYFQAISLASRNNTKSQVQRNTGKILNSYHISQHTKHETYCRNQVLQPAVKKLIVGTNRENDYKMEYNDREHLNTQLGHIRNVYD